MDEKDLATYALFTGLIGFLVLGYVILYIPIDVDKDELNYIDGKVQRISSTENGVIVTAQDVGSYAYIIEQNLNLSVGDTVRLYDPQHISPTSDLQKVEYARKLVPR